MQAKSAQSTSNKILTDLLRNEGRYFLLSTQSYSRSYAPKDINANPHRNSFFTKYVIQGFNGVKPKVDEEGRTIQETGSVDDNGYVTPESLYRYVRDRVRAEVSSQDPVLRSTLSGDTVLLASYPQLKKVVVTKPSQGAQLSQVGSAEVSYIILQVHRGSIPELLKNLAVAINVELNLEGDVLPFVAFNGFDDGLHQKKVFVYGPSGCGKSRSLFEFINSKVMDYDNLYIINPRNPVGNKIERGTILQVITESSKKSPIIWDNFPDDLVRRDIESIVGVLELLSSRD